MEFTTYEKEKERKQYLSAQAAEHEAEKARRRGSAPGITAYDVIVAEGRSLRIDTTNGVYRQMSFQPISCEKLNKFQASN